MEPAEYISYGKQWIDENDIQAVVSTLRSDRLTQGPKIDEFEKALAGFCGARFAVAVNSGTSALHIACLAAGVQEGDEVITSPNTFVASANCAVYCGARPVFADIEPDTYNIIPQEMANKITPLTKAVIPVHFSGQSCDMVSIKNIIQEEEKSADKKIYIIEDACHALGSAYKGRKIGSCFYSDMTVMSFHPVKHITTGEGGAVLTNNESLYNRLKRFRSHGITSVPDEFIYKEEAFETSEGGFSQVRPWYYEQVALGYNYRITDLQCALGISQLKKIVSFCKRRREIVNMYNEAFNDVNTLQTPFQSGDCDSYFHIYVLLFDWKAIGMNRTQFMLELRSRGIQTQVHYIPVPLHPYYRENFGTDLRDFPNTEKYYKGCLSIPLYPAMTDMDAKKVVAEILRLAVRS
ncbi:MAG: UDP-4-amino-4,6-dideoxy-N-acetyl-beta-L-altrosamine transaminase [Thermodesulfovibrionia bacterium]|nr:UDP-4-amino-4,6-dideoxy-N-acetyl-beta-L-altrosamine transaminase [Thermodesulfovibrionia bacterium]